MGQPSRYAGAPMKSRIWTDPAALRREIDAQRAAGKTIVTANGCFEILHVGHVRYLEAARAEGDLLVVLVNDDESMERVKLDRHSLVPASERMEMLAALKAVDYVIPFSEDTPHELLAQLHPDVHAKGTDYRPEDLPEKEVVEGNGGRIAIVGDPKNHSVSDLRDRLARDDRAGFTSQ